MNKKKLVTLLGSLLFLLLLGGCSKGNAADEKVTIYTNADEEPVSRMFWTKMATRANTIYNLLARLN